MKVRCDNCGHVTSDLADITNSREYWILKDDNPAIDNHDGRFASVCNKCQNYIIDQIVKENLRLKK